jgi:U3 small nucleolar RNA-associated protein 10
MPSKSRTIISFTSIVVVEMLAAVPSVTTSTINKILPCVMHSFEAGVTEEYRVIVPIV